MILVCGELVLDLVRESGSSSPVGPVRYVAHPGGSPANTAVALARLGTNAGLCARISRNSAGMLLRSHLVANAVDLTYAIDVDEPATLAFVDVGPDGKPSYSFYVDGTADWQWTAAELPSVLPDSVAVLHTGSMAALATPGRQAIVDLLSREQGNRLLSFDPNIRPPFATNSEDARRWIEGLIARVHLVKASDEDIAWLYPGEGIDAVAARWRSLGAAAVVVTLGAEGSIGYLDGARIKRPAIRVEVVDTVGAGDAFSAALLHWLDQERLTAQTISGELSTEALGDALVFASSAAAIACSRAGADPPSVAEVDALSGVGPHARTREGPGTLA